VLVDDATGSFAHALPARLRAADVPGGGAAADLLGLKWIAGSASNRASGLPAMTAVIVLNDPTTGVPRAIMDGGVITAARTAALSAVGMRLLARIEPEGRQAVVVLVGAGAQARAHAEVTAAVLRDVELVIFDRHPERAEALADAALAMPGIARASAASDPRAAFRRADVIISATTVGAADPALFAADVGPETLIVPVDYGAYVSDDLVRSASTFVVDDRRQFEANRASGRLADWPDPSATFAELLLEPAVRPRGVAVALHQGPGVADIVVAAAVLRRALAQGEGQLLER
jgi:ornithine cyclodeaminase/alanine dehydrogenase-like protein (mu-crystallin family)